MKGTERPWGSAALLLFLKKVCLGYRAEGMVNREGQLLNTIGFFFRCLNADRTQFTQLTAISSSDAQAGNAQATCSTHGVDDVSRIAGGAQSNQQTLSSLSIGVNLLGKD